MAKKEKLRGQTTRTDSPNWEPLLYLARVYVAEFMWMFEVELEGGLRIHAYKHVITRRYLHLSEDGRAFAYCWPGNYPDLPDDPGPSFYQEVDPRRMIDLVMPCRLDPEEAHCPPRQIVDE